MSQNIGLLRCDISAWSKQSQVPRLREKKKISFINSDLKITISSDLRSVSGWIFVYFFDPKKISKKLLDQTHFILIFKGFSLIFDENLGFQKSILLRLYIGKIS